MVCGLFCSATVRSNLTFALQSVLTLQSFFWTRFTNNEHLFYDTHPHRSCLQMTQAIEEPRYRHVDSWNKDDLNVQTMTRNFILRDVSNYKMNSTDINYDRRWGWEKELQNGHPVSPQACFAFPSNSCRGPTSLKMFHVRASSLFLVFLCSLFTALQDPLFRSSVHHLR